MPIGPARMPLFDHLGELRMRLVRIVVMLVIAILIFYFAAPSMAQFLVSPIADVMGDEAGNVDLLFLDPFEGFAVRFKLAFWFSIIATSPVILWQLLAFFLPALKKKERKWFVPTFIAAVSLFVLGVVFCYLVILHPAFQWLTDQAMGMGTYEFKADSYISILIKFEIGFGIAFELPLVIFYLVIFDIIPYKKLRGSWRMVYIILLVFSAMVTPDASPVTMALMFAALIGLYELSLLAARIVLAKRIRKQNSELAAEEAEDADGDAAQPKAAKA
ncbi:MAG: twin-arginine translocase subunit TatC [Eggerthellaceae bacterium]|nr:twin-arginine translocase subunit TatC [Eggerthellaceae bacterium]